MEEWYVRIVIVKIKLTYELFVVDVKDGENKKYIANNESDIDIEPELYLRDMFVKLVHGLSNNIKIVSTYYSEQSQLFRITFNNFKIISCKLECLEDK